MSVEERILKLLKDVYPQDLYIKEIASKLNISRNTASKYIAVLEARDMVICRRISKIKLCRAKGR